jgi:hypothetical protein
MMRSFLPAALLAALSLYLAPASVHAQGEGGDGDCPGGYTWADSYLYADSYGWLYGYSTTYNVCSDVNISVGVAATVYDPSSNSITGGSQWSYWDGGDATVNLSAPAMSAGQYFIVGTHYLCYYDASWVEADPYNTQDSTYSAGPVPTVTGSLIDMYGVQTTWYADGSPNAINIWGIDLIGMIPSITATGCSTTTGGSAWSISGWSSNATSVSTNLTVSPYLSTACTITISLLGWLAQVQVAPGSAPAILPISSQNINDGDTGSFSVTVTGGIPTSYTWSYTLPIGNNSNNPEVTFTTPNAAQTSTDGHWYASASQCDSSLNPVYKIAVTVGFSYGGPLSGNSYLQVKVPWVPKGAETSQATITGYPQTIGMLGSWYVLSPGTLQRTQPLTTFDVPQTSQFFHKVATHEQVHLNQWVGDGTFAKLFQVADLYAQLVNLSDTTEAGLDGQIAKKIYDYIVAQNAIYTAGIPAAEAEAYRASDTMAPLYIYQSACGNQP